MVIKSPFLFLPLLVFTFSSLLAQPVQTKNYRIERTYEKPELDGVLNEDLWAKTELTANFYQNFPADSIKSWDETFVRMTYDEEFLYVGIYCEDSLPGVPISQTLRRDFDWGSNDNVSIYFDPFNDQSNGFTFQITPFNVQRDGLVTLGGRVADDWDNKWFSATTYNDSSWMAEMAIPFKSIRYNSIPSWGLQILRNNQKLNERSGWISTPLNFSSSDLLYTGRLIWDAPPPEQGANISFIPYVTGVADRNFEENTGENTFNAGFDAKIGVSNALNLDFTVNPDFSQVEADRQVTNLSRFEISFPERRQFFLENQDLFSQGAFGSTRPFFSRRIGIARDSAGVVRQIPIIAGTRLSGKIGEKWRVGALNIATAADEETAQPIQNYSVIAIQRQVFKRSNIVFTAVNRNAVDRLTNDSLNTVFNENRGLTENLNRRDSTTEFNRVFGVDYNLATVNNRWSGDFHYYRSFEPNNPDKAYTFGTFLQYRTPSLRLNVVNSSVGDNYNAEVGFVQRTGIHTQGGEIEYDFFVNSNWIQRHGPNIEYRHTLDEVNWGLLDRRIELNYDINTLNRSSMEIGYQTEMITLLDPFDPTNTDGLELPADEEYRSTFGYLEYRSDPRKIVSLRARGGFGSFFNGTRIGIVGTLTFRAPPFLNVDLSADYNQLDLPEPFNSAKFLLLGPRVDFTVTNNLFFTSFLQYNTQTNRFSQNHRFQWRFKPVSDLFIVYTDNYLTPTLEPVNRTLVIKLSYWLNV